MNCPYCDEEIGNTVLVCPHCGRDIYLVRALKKRVAELEKRIAGLGPKVPTGLTSVTTQESWTRRFVLALLYIAFIVSEALAPGWSYNLAFSADASRGLAQLLLRTAAFALTFGPVVAFGVVIGAATRKRPAYLDLAVGLAGAIVLFAGTARWTLAGALEQIRPGWLVIAFGFPILFWVSTLSGGVARRNILRQRSTSSSRHIGQAEREEPKAGQFTAVMTALSPILTFFGGILTPLILALLHLK